MTLTNLTDFPPRGFLYREPAANWQVPQDIALIGIREVAMALQTVRVQNPALGLDPSYEACLQAIKDYTCARLQGDPRFCGPQPPESEQDHSRPQTGRKGCASCGRR